MEGKISKIYPVLDLGVEYASGTDGNLNSPNDDYNQNDVFIPVQNGPSEMTLYIGDYRWTGDNAGPSQILYGENVGTIYGTVRWVARWYGGTYYNWNTFPTSSYDGIQRMGLPKSGNNDKLGGYIDFYYHRDAFYAAFNGNQSDCIITVDGSVFKDSVSYDNLVVSGKGVVGKAGGGNPSIGNNSLNSISDEVIQISKHGEHIIL